jgi:hypothetical protein
MLQASQWGLIRSRIAACKELGEDNSFAGRASKCKWEQSRFGNMGSEGTYLNATLG